MNINYYKIVDIQNVMKLEVVAPDSVSVGDSIRCVVRFINTSDQDVVFNKNGRLNISGAFDFCIDREEVVFGSTLPIINESFNKSTPYENIILSPNERFEVKILLPSIQAYWGQKGHDPKKIKALEGHSVRMLFFYRNSYKYWLPLLDDAVCGSFGKNHIIYIRKIGV